LLATIQEAIGRLFLDHNRFLDAQKKLQEGIDSFKEELKKEANPGLIRFIRFIESENYKRLAAALSGQGKEKEAEEAMRESENFRPQP